MTHPSRQRSRSGIIHSLLSLMKEKNYYEITIQEIADKANLVRRTFYRNFSSKQDVLKCAMQNVISEADSLMNSVRIRTFSEFLPLFFEFWAERKDFLSLLDKNNLLERLLPDFEEWLMRQPSLQGWLQDQDQKEINLTGVCLAGACWNILCWWVRQGMMETPGQITELTLRSLRKTILE